MNNLVNIEESPSNDEQIRNPEPESVKIESNAINLPSEPQKSDCLPPTAGIPETIPQLDATSEPPLATLPVHMAGESGVNGEPPKEAEPKVVAAKKEAGEGIVVDENGRFVLSVRGLSWTCTVEDVHEFFGHCDDIIVIHMVGGSNGRSSGEALVEFATIQGYHRGIQRNNRTCNGRPVEVRQSSDRKLDRSLGRIPLPKVPSNPMSYVIRMRGVPYEATIEDIEEFFGDLQPLAIHIPRDSYGRPSGDAFVEFEKHEDGYQATYRHRECLGHRYIEIFQSTIRELCVAMGVSMKSTSFKKRWIKMQGLPHSTQLVQVLGFFATVKVLPIRLARRSDGCQVFAEFASTEDVTNMMKLQHRYIGHRYVELFPCDTAEVELATGKKFEPIQSKNLQKQNMFLQHQAQQNLAQVSPLQQFRIANSPGPAVPHFPAQYFPPQNPIPALIPPGSATSSPVPNQFQQLTQQFLQPMILHPASNSPSPASKISQMSNSPRLYQT